MESYPDDESKIKSPTRPKPLRRYDSLDMESAKVSGQHGGHGTQLVSWGIILRLAFQSIGVIFGDIGTSPLYVYSSTFTSGIKHRDDVLGVLSLIFYTFTLLPVIKYAIIVLRANDNGNGGTFALYSLLCRHVKVGQLPSQQAEDVEVSNYSLQMPSRSLKCSWKVQTFLENSPFAKMALLIITMLSTALVIGDGILTPSISVLSAVGGIKAATPAMTDGLVVWISVAILIMLFSVQRFGTDKVGYSFAPIVCTWLALNASIGVYNIVKYDTLVFKALNPWYIIEYFTRNGMDAWVSLGGVVLAITGLEALFADLGHFTVKSVQISICLVAYPALILTYTGQASYLRVHPEDVADTFFKSIPGPIYWFVFVVAVMAAIIASQAMISGTFSIIHQSLSHGCFPRVKVVHTSDKYEGQVYIPELNFFLMVGCVCVTLAFRSTTNIGHAYGIAIVLAETITSFFAVLVMILIWKINILLIIAYIVIIMSIELTYLSSVLYKFSHGGYLPLAFACVFMLVMITWNYVYRKKYYYELDHKVSPDQLRELTNKTATNLCKIPGVAIFYSELVHGIPPIFNHYASNVAALHSVLVFVSMKSLPVNKVPVEERFLFRRIEGTGEGIRVFRCIVRYGYTDVRREEESFETVLVQRLKEFMHEESFIKMLSTNSPSKQPHTENTNHEDDQQQQEIHSDRIVDGVEDINEDERAKRETEEEEKRQKELEEEIQGLQKAENDGVVHLVGESEVTARNDSGLVKRIVVDYCYSFIRRNVRQSGELLDIPHTRLLKVGMTYEL